MQQEYEEEQERVVSLRISIIFFFSVFNNQRKFGTTIFNAQMEIWDYMYHYHIYLQCTCIEVSLLVCEYANLLSV